MSGVFGPQPSQNILRHLALAREAVDDGELGDVARRVALHLAIRHRQFLVMKSSSQWNGRSSAACIVSRARFGGNGEIVGGQLAGRY